MAQAATTATAVQEVKLEDSSNILARLQQGLEVGDEALQKRYDALEVQMKATDKIADAQQRSIALQIIQADMQSLITSSQKEEADLAVAVSGLDSLAEQLSGDFEKLQQLNEAERKMITDAETAVETAKGAWIHRDAKVKAATQLLEQTKLEAAKSMRKRLMSAKFEESTAVFKRRVVETVRILEKRRGLVDTQLKNVIARKAASFKIMEEAAKAKTDLEGKLSTAQADLQAAESELNAYTNGTPEYARQDVIVSDLKAKVVDLTGQVNVALTIYQSKERFSKQLGVHETTQNKLKNNISMWISGLKSDTEERVATIESRLEAQKAMSDQEIASQIDKIGAKLDQQNTEFMAKAGRVSDQLMLERLEAQPERMRKLDEVAVAQAQAHINTTQRLLALREQYQNRYGIDLLASSFLDHGNTGTSAPAG